MVTSASLTATAAPTADAEAVDPSTVCPSAIVWAPPAVVARIATVPECALGVPPFASTISDPDVGST